MVFIRAGIRTIRIIICILFVSELGACIHRTPMGNFTFHYNISRVGTYTQSPNVMHCTLRTHAAIVYLNIISNKY